MFKKLRFRLIVINAGIMLNFFLLLIGSAYYFSQFNLNDNAAALKTWLVNSIMAGIVGVLFSLCAGFFLSNRAIAPVEKAWQQQKNFLSDASHELRTPLTVIQTNLDIVRGNPSESVSTLNKWLDNIQEECIAMRQLVDSLLFLARTDSGQQTLSKRDFAFASLLVRTVDAFAPVAAVKGISLAVACADSSIMFHGDEARIKQVIGILLDNALRHTSAGGQVSVSLSQSSNKLLLTVSDSGEGIEAKHLEKIFTRFYQVDQSRSKGSSGLGLAIAKWIIEAHGGAITVASTFGAGTTFTVQFPCNTDQKLHIVPSSTITG